VIELSAYLVGEGYALIDFLDYDNGMPLDHMIALKTEAQKIAIERRRSEVDGMVVALGSMFDKKILKQFNAAVDKVLRSLGPIREETREEKVARTMRNLQNFQTQLAQRGLMGMHGPGDDIPPWERQ